MSDRLTNKVVVISCGAREMGASHARVMAQQGASVVIVDVLDELGDKVAQQIRDKGGSAAYLHADVTKAADWQRVFETATKEYGPLTTLVNNAGVIGSMLGAADETEEAWHQTIAINQTGVFLGMKCAVPLMQQNGGGSIVNICSISPARKSPSTAAI